MIPRSIIPINKFDIVTESFYCSKESDYWVYFVTDLLSHDSKISYMYKKTMIILTKNKAIKILCVLLFIAVFVYLFSKIVPYTMDEFIQYHAIICHHYPWNHLNKFRESCGGYDLNLLNTTIKAPLRVYEYVGSFTAVYYYPLFLIWKSPLSARFIGMIFLLIQSLVLSKLFRINFLYIFIGLIGFFPYFFQHIVDIGPVALQTSSVLITYFLINKWIKTLQIKYPLCIAVLTFINIWTKLSYFWELPGLFILLLVKYWGHIQPNKSNVRIFFKQFLLSFFILSALCYFLFFSTSPDNPNVRPYINVIKTSTSYTLKEMMQGKWLQSRVINYLINPLQGTDWIYKVSPPTNFSYIYDLFNYISIPLILLLLYFKLKTKGKGELLHPTIYYVTFIITLLVIMRTKDARHMHHTILAFPYLILSTISTLKFLSELPKEHFSLRFLASRWLIIFILLNSFLFFTFSKQPLRSYSDPSIIQINKFLNNNDLARKYFYVCVDWGMYYYQGLYGPHNQSVLYLQPLNSQRQIDDLKNLSKDHNRKLMFIHNTVNPGSDIGLIRSSFNVERWNKINENSAWQVLLER